MEILAAVSNNTLTPAARNDGVIKIALRAMATQPEDRYPGVREFQQSLRRRRYRREPR
jgi:hypothetical protein